MTLAHAPLSESSHRPNGADSLPFRIPPDVPRFPINSIVEAERVGTPSGSPEVPTHVTPDTPNGHTMAEHQSNIGHAPPDVDRARENDAAIARHMQRTTEGYMDGFIRAGHQVRIEPAPFGELSDEQVAQRLAAERQTRAGQNIPSSETPLARVQTSYVEPRRSRRERAFRSDDK